MTKIKSSEITPEIVYNSRRRFLAGIGAAGAAVVLNACRSRASSVSEETNPMATLRNELTPFEAITTYNNFYEFSLDKEQVAVIARGFRTSPWKVAVGGLVNKPRTFEIDEVTRRFTQEERIYRLRCVEAWSMVIPWQGFPLKKLLEAVEPTPKAKYIRFETVRRPIEMPGLNQGGFPWPYVEGLRLDEAMTDLALLVTGL